MSHREQKHFHHNDKGFKSEFSKYYEQNPNESVRSWLQRITAMQNEIQRKQKQVYSNTTNQTAIDYQQKNSNNSYTQQNVTPTHTPPGRVVKYQDLPYMGEMTLDNSKPRRGRKPKKADICHLIYKNYGTIFPGTPKSLVDQEPTKKQNKSQKETPVQRTNVQNRIISSLLEKRLTQESQRNKEILKGINRNTPNKVNDQEEPLNLCIRDLNQLKIRLLRKHGNVYASDPVVNEVKSEPVSDDDVEFVDEIPSPSLSVKAPDTSPSDAENSVMEPSMKSPDLNTAPGGYVYWPNAGVFIHPTAFQSQLLYYQKLAANGSYTLPSPCPEASVTPDVESPPSPELRKLVPKHLLRLQDKQDENEVSVETRLKRVATQSSNTPMKRKRSAIFIPPIPTENQTNPATEVSICKFKFTGGAKPSLEEKKMLSVDSGGNFRYYSGTGDKSMRGYEFFPRETLQQAGSSHGSSTGAFLQASGEKIPIIPTTNEGRHGNFLFSPETTLQPLPTQEAADRRHKKRKTRKSLQREKLEQTFKEKGFLIQTQQLESAEGATYCKFRQLRKFTRYLFRSWKDYLPGNVRELHEADKSDDEEVDENVMNAHINTSDM